MTGPRPPAAPPDLLADVRPAGAGPRPTRGRSLLVAAMVVVVALGLTGVLGVRSGTVRDEGGGHALAVTYAEVARAGWDVPFTVEVVRAGGWGGEDVVLRVSAEYFAIFETQGFDPEPSAETNDGRWLHLTFDPPPGDTFTLDYDAYVQPASQRGRAAEVAVLVDDAPVVDVRLRTRLLP